MEYTVLFTHQKTKKAKTWQDGILSVVGNKAILYDDKKTKLDSMHIKPEMIVKGEQLESDRYFILIEDEKSLVQTLREPVQPVTCPVRVPVRTGLKRKRTGFVPPRVIRQPDNQVDPPSSSDADNIGNSYLDILKRNKQDSSNIDDGYKSIIRDNRDVLQLYSSAGYPHQAKMPLPSNCGGMDERNSSKEICLSPNVIENNAGQPVAKSPSMTSTCINLQSQTPSNLCSPWSSYGTKMKPLSNLSPKGSLSPLIHNRMVKLSNESESQESQLDNSESEQCLISADDFQNATVSSKKWQRDQRQRENTDVVKSGDTAIPADPGSKRSMSQIMALLGKQKSASSTNDQTHFRQSLYQTNKPVKKYHDSTRADLPGNFNDNDYACSDVMDVVKEEIIEHRTNKKSNAVIIDHVDKQIIDKGKVSCHQISSLDEERLKLDNQPKFEAGNVKNISTMAKCEMQINNVKNKELSPFAFGNKTKIKENVEPKGIKILVEIESDSLQEELSNNSQKLSFTNDIKLPINDENEMQKLTQCDMDRHTLDSQDMSQDYTEDDLAVSFDINFSPLSQVSDSDSIILDSIDQCEVEDDMDGINQCEVKDNMDEIDQCVEMKDDMDGIDKCEEIKDNIDWNIQSEEIKNDADGINLCEEIKDNLDGIDQCEEINSMDGINQCEKVKHDMNRINQCEEIKNNMDGIDQCEEVKDNTDGIKKFEEIKDNMDGVNQCEEVKEEKDGMSECEEIKNNMDRINQCEEVKEDIHVDGINQCEEVEEDIHVDGINHCEEIKDNMDWSKQCEEMPKHSYSSNDLHCGTSQENLEMKYLDSFEEFMDSFDSSEIHNVYKSPQVLATLQVDKEKERKNMDLKMSCKSENTVGHHNDNESTVLHVNDSLFKIGLGPSNIKAGLEKDNEKLEKEISMGFNQKESKDPTVDNDKMAGKSKDSDLQSATEIGHLNIQTEQMHKVNNQNSERRCAGNFGKVIDKIPCLYFSNKSERENNKFGIRLNDLKFSPESFDLSQDSQNTQHSVGNKLNDNGILQVLCRTGDICNKTSLSVNCVNNRMANPDTYLSENNENSGLIQSGEKFESSFDAKESVTINASQTDSYMDTEREEIVQRFQDFNKSNCVTANKSAEHLNNEDIYVKCHKMNDTFEYGTSDQYLDTTKDTDKEYCITDNISQNSYKGDNLIHFMGGYAYQHKGGSSYEGKNSVAYNENKAQHTSEIDDTHTYCISSPEFKHVRQGIPITEKKAVPVLSNIASQSCVPCFTGEQVQHINKPRSLLTSSNELQHPQDVFGKRRKMSLIPDQSFNTRQHLEIRTDHVSSIGEDQSKDLRCTASEKLENYMMKGSIVSGAARRQESPVPECDMEESFYIDFSTEKPSIQSKNIPSLSSKFYSTPAQFVPNTPDLFKSMKTQGSSQNSGDHSSPNRMYLSSEENVEYEDKQRLLRTSKCLNTSRLSNPCYSTSTHKKLKTPLISSPYEDKTLKLEDRNLAVDDNEDMSYPTENPETILTDDSDSCKMKPANSSCDPLTKLTYWEEKLLQRQKCGNIFINNDTECSWEKSDDEKHRNQNYIQSTERTVPDGDKYSIISSCNRREPGSITSNCIRREPVSYVITGESSLSVGYNATNNNGRYKMYPSVNLFDKEKNIGLGNDSKGLFQSDINEGQGSKWGKYESEDEDDFLTFDSSFSLPSVGDRMKNYSEQQFTLRPPTSHIHNKSIDNVEHCTADMECFNETFEDEKFTSTGNLSNESAAKKERDVLSLPKSQSYTERMLVSKINHGELFQVISDEYSESDHQSLENDVLSENRQRGSFVLKPNLIERNYSLSKVPENTQLVSNISSDFNCHSSVYSKNTETFPVEQNSIGLNKRFKCPQQRFIKDSGPLGNGSVSKSDNEGAGSSKRFKCPVPQLTSCILKGTKRNLGSDLQFPSLLEVTENSQPTRDIQIPAVFSSLSLYKQIFTAALKGRPYSVIKDVVAQLCDVLVESHMDFPKVLLLPIQGLPLKHLNIILFDLGVKYHHALAKIDTTSYFPSGAGKENKGPVNSNPVCKCGAPSKMIQVKKSGPNQNRFFYACNAARNNQCKFFQWADDKRGSNTKNGNDKLTMSDPSSITTFIRSHYVHFYCDCSFVKKSSENIMNHFKRNVPNWVKQKMGMDTTVKKRMYIQLSRKDNSGIYSKDDLWIVSKQLDFQPSSTILCRSTYYGPTSGNEIEIEPIGSFSPSNWPNAEKCHAILAGNVTGELSYLYNLEDSITLTNVPVLQTLLSSDIDSSSSGFNAPARLQGNTNIYIPESYMDQQVEEMINQYKLNDDQSTALLRVARMFTHSDQNDFVLIHGVFGAGKSFLLSVVVLFLVWLFEKNDSYTPGVPFPWKLVIASTTNVAVDRILNGLLALGFEDFVRVGSVKKISKPVLPYSVHGTGSDSQELKDLQMMLRSGELTATEKQNVRQSIERHKLGENRKRLGKVRVVGVTCASCSSLNLKDMQFPIVLLDECSQMTEPASMLPVAKFQCQKLVLVGDPKQLDPTIQGSESTTEQGLEQTLFDRLILMGHSPVMLHTQYRCHPHISGVSNSLFYSNTLQDGILQSDRLSVMKDLPALCFYDVMDGIEESDSGGSFYNEKEAKFIIFLIEVLIDREVDADRIGVISLYKSQMYKIMTLLGTNKNCQELKAVMVSTVDAFQGGERDVIILSCVRSRNVGFIDNEKRTNVALTRARHHLLIVGNENNLKKNKLWRQIIQHCKDTSQDGVQRADIVREKFKIQEQVSDESSLSKSKKRNQTQMSDNSSSPPMSLSGSSKSSLREITDNKAGSMANDMAGIQIHPNSSDSQEFTTTNGKHRRKRRRIDASLLDCDNMYNSSDDEDLPVIFDTS